MNKTLALVVFLVVAACGPGPQPVTPKPVPTATAGTPSAADEPLPLDSRVHTGKLANGLRYYVMQHKKPEHRAQMWLAVNAGSVLEDDDQQGLAHFVEHMAFNGTTHFPKQAIVDLLEKSGVSFGADLNASTSFDQTVYTLKVPTDKPELLAESLDILRDWTDSVTFDPVEVDKERGVVLEEWRLGRGAAKRVFDKQAHVLFHGSKYADRLPIGKPEIIKTASPDVLKRFYRDWYRPDLMAVIAVGDFDPHDIETKIEQRFASVKPAAKPRTREAVAVPPHAEQLVTIETDPEATMASVALTTKIPHRPLATARDYRRLVAERLYNTMLNARLDELRRKPDAPFLFALSLSGPLVRTEDDFVQLASVKEDAVQEGFAALLEEELRVERNGFLQSELDRAKTDVLRQLEQAVTQHDTTDGRAFATEIQRLFLESEAMPGPEAELALTQKLLPTYTLAELEAIGKTLGQGSRVIAISGPEKMNKPAEAAVRATAAAVAARDIKPYVDAALNVPLMTDKPTPGPVVATKSLPELGVTEWTLKNGVHVVVKPTDFKTDDIKLTGFANGGTSLAPDADYDSDRFAATIVSQSGVGTFDATALRKALSGKLASVHPSIGELEQGVSGGGSAKDLETIMQLTYLTFTAPRKDPGAFAAWKTQQVEFTKNRRLSPESFFDDELLVLTDQNHKRRQPLTPELFDHVDLDKAFAFYKQRFADASGFTFVLVGTMDLDKTKSLVETYLGSLPASGHKETWRDINVQHPSGIAKKAVAKGSEPKSRVSYMFHGSEPWSRDASNDMKMLGEVLRIRLREVLREDMGGVYHVSASGSVSRRPKQRYTFDVSFGCAPENIDKLERALFDEIKALQTKGIGDDYIAKVKEIRRRSHETALRDNGWWLEELEDAYSFGDDPKLILDFDKWVDKVSSDRVKAAAKKYLGTQYVLGELRPAP